MKKITSFTHHITAEGDRLTCTYSEINEEGKLINSNVRETYIVLDQAIQHNINAIKDFLTGKIDK